MLKFLPCKTAGQLATQTHHIDPYDAHMDKPTYLYCCWYSKTCFLSSSILSMVSVRTICFVGTSTSPLSPRFLLKQQQYTWSFTDRLDNHWPAYCIHNTNNHKTFLPSSSLMTLTKLNNIITIMNISQRTTVRASVSVCGLDTHCWRQEKPFLCSTPPPPPPPSSHSFLPALQTSQQSNHFISHKWMEVWHRSASNEWKCDTDQPQMNENMTQISLKWMKVWQISLKWMKAWHRSASNEWKCDRSASNEWKCDTDQPQMNGSVTQISLKWMKVWHRSASNEWKCDRSASNEWKCDTDQPQMNGSVTDQPQMNESVTQISLKWMEVWHRSASNEWKCDTDQPQMNESVTQISLKWMKVWHRSASNEWKCDTEEFPSHSLSPTQSLTFTHTYTRHRESHSCTYSPTYLRYNSKI